MSKPLKVLNDFPLESQVADYPVTISVNPAGMMLIQKAPEEDTNAILLTKEQTIEVIRLCQGRIIGALTNTHIKLVADIDQSLALLREHEPLIQQLSMGGPEVIQEWLHHERDSEDEDPTEILHAMATLTFLFMKDSAVTAPT